MPSSLHRAVDTEADLAADIEVDNKQVQAFVPPSAGVTVEALQEATSEELHVLATALTPGVASSVAHMVSDLHLASGHATQEADNTVAHTDVAAA
jgi:hypothetical protein